MTGAAISLVIVLLTGFTTIALAQDVATKPSSSDTRDATKQSRRLATEKAGREGRYEEVTRLLIEAMQTDFKVEDCRNWIPTYLTQSPNPKPDMVLAFRHAIELFQRGDLRSDRPFARACLLAMWDVCCYGQLDPSTSLDWYRRLLADPRLAAELQKDSAAEDRRRRMLSTLDTASGYVAPNAKLLHATVWQTIWLGALQPQGANGKRVRDLSKTLGTLRWDDKTLDLSPWFETGGLGLITDDEMFSAAYFDSRVEETAPPAPDSWNVLAIEPYWKALYAYANAISRGEMPREHRARVIALLAAAREVVSCRELYMSPETADPDRQELLWMMGRSVAAPLRAAYFSAAGTVASRLISCGDFDTAAPIIDAAEKIRDAVPEYVQLIRTSRTFAFGDLFSAMNALFEYDTAYAELRLHQGRTEEALERARESWKVYVGDSEERPSLLAGLFPTVDKVEDPAANWSRLVRDLEMRMHYMRLADRLHRALIASALQFGASSGDVAALVDEGRGRIASAFATVGRSMRPPPITPASVQPPRTAILMFTWLPDGLHTWITSPDETVTHDRTTVDRFQLQRALRDYDLSNTASGSDRALKDISELVLSPTVQCQLAALKVAYLIIVPDQDLWLVPWCALSVKGTYLVNRAVLITSVSARAAVSSLGRAPSVDASDGSKSMIVANPLPLDPALGLPHLMAAEREAGAVSDRLSAERCDGTAAQREAIVKKLSRDFAVLHWAVHAQSGSDPAEQWLALGTAKGDRSKGLVTSRELFEAEPRASLVVLSACDSARGESSPLEGVIGLARPFLLLGAECVIASLRPVDDDFASEFMERYYENLAGLDSATALTMTQRYFASHRHPASQWGQFAAIGGTVRINGLRATHRFPIAVRNWRFRMIPAFAFGASVTIVLILAVVSWRTRSRHSLVADSAQEAA